jgi:hypothetical protein
MSAELEERTSTPLTPRSRFLPGNILLTSDDLSRALAGRGLRNTYSNTFTILTCGDFFAPISERS